MAAGALAVFARVRSAEFSVNQRLGTTGGAAVAGETWCMHISHMPPRSASILSRHRHRHTGNSIDCL